MINKVTGKINCVYAELDNDPCVFCKNTDTCDKSRKRDCYVHCG